MTIAACCVRLGLVSGTALALAEVGGGPSGPGKTVSDAGGETQGTPTPVTPPTTSAPAALTGTFAVLRAARGASDALPGSDAHNDPGLLGANPALSRLALRAEAGSVYAVPGSSGLCVAFVAAGQSETAGSCTPTAAASKAGAVAWQPCGAGGMTAEGVVPDGVTSVALRSGTTDIARVAVVNNGFVIGADGQSADNLRLSSGEVQALPSPPC